MALTLVLNAIPARLPGAQQPPPDSLVQLSLDRQVFALARLLEADSAIGGEVRGCLMGHVHAAFRRTDVAVTSLRQCVEGPNPPELVRRALEQLVPIYMAAGRTQEAQDVLTRLLTSFPADAPEDSAGWASGLSLARATGRGGPMRVVSRSPTRVRAQRNQLGMLLVPVTVNDTAEELLLDTGAGLSVLIASLAERLGVRLVPETVSVTGGTGVRMAARLGLATVVLAGVVMENVPFLVLPDSLLNVRAGPIQYQVRGIVGLPVLVALEEFSLSKDGWLNVPATPRLRGPPNMALDGQRLIVEATLDGAPGAFYLDTGARSTNLYPRARPLLGKRVESGTAGTMQIGSAGGTQTVTVVRLPEVAVGLGDTTVVLRGVPLLDEAHTTRARHAAGNIGQDVLGAAPVITFNLRQMILRLGGTP